MNSQGLEEIVMSLYRSTIQNVVWTDKWKTLRTSITIASNLAEIRTWYVQIQT